MSEDKHMNTSGDALWDLINVDNERMNTTRVLVPKTIRSQKRPATGKIDIEDSIRAAFEPAGAIPKRFGQVLYASEANKPLGQLRVPQNDVPTGGRGSEGVFPKSKFTIFDEGGLGRSGTDQMISAEAKRINMKFLASSTMIEDDVSPLLTHEAFSKAKDFFKRKEVSLENRIDGIEKRREFKRKPKLHTLQEITNKTPGLIPPPPRVRQVIQQLGASKITPHDVPPPIPEKIKLVHKSIQDNEEAHKYGAISKREEADWPYLDEFIKYEEEKEKFRSFTPNYRKINASVDQRQTIVHFLIRIGTHNCLPSYMIYQTVRVFDDVLQARQIPLQNLQLVMISALWVIMKREYISYRLSSAQKMANFSDGLYSDADVRSGEKQIVQALNFKLAYSEPFSMLAYFTMSLNHSGFMTQQQKENIYYYGGYMLDLALLDEELLRISPILLAATATEMATTFVLEAPNSSYSSLFPRWRPPYSSLRFKKQEIAYYQGILLRNIAESYLRTSKSWVVYRKYCKSRYGRVAMELIEKIKTMQPFNMPQ